MTAQVEDFLMYEGIKYEVLGDSSGELPLLKKYNLTPASFSTGCWRGYIAHYAIVGNSLFLKYLYVFDVSQNYPTIAHIAPRIDVGSCAEYEHLHEKMNVSTSLVIGRDAVSWNDFRYPTNYKTALRLNFVKGDLQSVEDISVQAALLRQKIERILDEREQQPDSLFVDYKSEEMSELLKQAFDMKLSKASK